MGGIIVHYLSVKPVAPLPMEAWAALKADAAQFLVTLSPILYADTETGWQGLALEVSSDGGEAIVKVVTDAATRTALGTVAESATKFKNEWQKRLRNVPALAGCTVSVLAWVGIERHEDYVIAAQAVIEYMGKSPDKWAQGE